MLSRAGWVTLAAGTACLAVYLVFDYGLLGGLAAMCICALVAGYLSTLRRPELAAYQILSPPAVGVDEPAMVEVTVSNRGSRRTSRLSAVESLADQQIEVPIPPLAPGASDVCRLDVPTTKRGMFAIGPLEVTSGDPLGLFRSTALTGPSVTLTVHPRVHRMRPLPTGHRREMDGSATRRAMEGGISFHSLREYVPGDDLRLVHWRSVASRPDGELMVRKNVITTEPRLMVLLDTSSDPYDGDAFEDAVSVAASLVAAGCESHYPVLFSTTDGRSAAAAPSGEGRAQIMALLAEVQPGDDAGLATVASVAERADGVSLGVVTGQPSGESTEAITRARHRFDMVTVVQVGERFNRPPMSIPGALVLNGTTAEDIASRWAERFGAAT